METNRPYSIYRLFDKRTPDVTRYVGMTTNLNTRFSQHLVADGQNPHKDEWVKEIGVEISKEVIEVQPDGKEARKREAYWIDFFLQQGMPLLNQSIPSLTPKPSRQNTEKYAYFSVGILRTSDTYSKIMQDAKNSSYATEIAKLLGIRIGDYYKGLTHPVESNVVTDNSKSNALAALDEWG